MRIHWRTGSLTAALAILLMPGLAGAEQFLPPQKWMASVRSEMPFLSYKLGMIDFEEGTGGDWAEYSGDLRVALRDSNFFDKSAERRVRIRVTRGYADLVVDNERMVSTGKLVVVYRFLDGEQVVLEQKIVTQSLTDMYANSSDPHASMAANLRLLLISLRKARGDAEFLARAERMEHDIREDLAGKGVGLSGMMTRGFVAGVEGTIAVAKGVGEVAGTALEVAASPEFQTAMNDAMAEQAQQQAQQQAMLDQIRRDADEAQRAKELERERLAAAKAEEARQAELAQRSQANAQIAQDNARQQQQVTQQQQLADQRRQEEQRRLAEQQRVEAQRKEIERQRLAEQQRLEAQRKAEQERIAAQRRKEEERKAAEARRGIGTPVQLASAPPIGTLTRDWTQWYRYGSHNNVDVYWRARLYDDGIRVQWRCANGTSDKRYCSIGGENNGNKIYYCYRGTAQIGRGGAMGEASDVRPGGDFEFVGETSCSRMDATFILPEVRISAVIPVW